MNRGKRESRKTRAVVERKDWTKRAGAEEREDAEEGLETFSLEPIGDVVFPPSSTKDDMPLPDDVQLETLSLWRT